MRSGPRQRYALETAALAGPLVAALILGLLIPHAHTINPPEINKRGPAQPEQYSIWEAFGKGFVSLNYSSSSMTPGSDMGGFRIQNLAGRPVVVPNAEYPLILSPNPLEFRTPEAGEPTTQDAILTPLFIPPLSSGVYAYGAAVTGTGVPASMDKSWGVNSSYASFPPWWCAEIKQFTAYDTPVYLGGQTVPRPLVELATKVDPALDKVRMDLISDRQYKIWDYLNETATVVVGKKPLVSEIEPKTRTEMNITLAATNIAFTATGAAVIADVVPPGFGMVEGSFAPAPTRIVKLFDGGQRIEWEFPFPAGIHDEKPDSTPTKFFTQFFTYRLMVPELDFGARYFLPSAISDSTNDGDFEARSAQPLLESVQILTHPSTFEFPPYPWWLFVAMVGATAAIAFVLRELNRRQGPQTPSETGGYSAPRTGPGGSPAPGPSSPGKGIEPPPAAVFQDTGRPSAARKAAAMKGKAPPPKGK